MSTSKSGDEDEQVRVAIIDDHHLLAGALAAALSAERFQVVVPTLSSLEEVESVLRSAAPHVALVDWDLGPLGNGAALLPALTAIRAKVLVVSGAGDESIGGRCLAEGAWAFLPKSCPLDSLVTAVREAAAGRPVIDPLVRDRLLLAWRRRQAADKEAWAPFTHLTQREASVLGRLMDGLSVERIAAESYGSTATVRSQVRAILTKLGVNSQLEAVAKAVRAGWTPPGG